MANVNAFVGYLLASTIVALVLSSLGEWNVLLRGNLIPAGLLLVPPLLIALVIKWARSGLVPLAQKSRGISAPGQLHVLVGNVGVLSSTIALTALGEFNGARGSIIFGVFLLSALVLVVGLVLVQFSHA